jgi:polyferredoxin
VKLPVILNWKAVRRTRQVSQILFFFLFLWLLFSAVKHIQPSENVDLFFRFNPLAALTGVMSTRTWIARLGWALITVALTLVFGRVWCGWVCPLGSLLDWTAFRSARRRSRLIPLWLRKVKVGLLAATLVMALFGSLSLLIFDPITLITRSFTVSIVPTVNYLVESLERFLYAVPTLRPMVDGFEGMVRGRLLPANQPAFDQNILIMLLLVALVSANWLADRFWCRYACPLGALLGLVSKFSIFRPVAAANCNHCTHCELVCRPGAIDAFREKPVVQTSECIMCLDCLASCSRRALELKPEPKFILNQETDLSRREALGFLAAGAASLVLMRTGVSSRTTNPLLLRPPGSQLEPSFLSACLRCSLCMKICPTSGLQPALDQAGLEAFWTPVLVPRLGSCEYGCNACGQVCPSGAIPNLTLAQKRQAVIGKALVDRDRCLPWASNVPCIVCEEMCPTPQKSIELEEAQVIFESGEELKLQRPRVIEDRCIGCGICENRCPLEGQAGIHVYANSRQV